MIYYKEVCVCVGRLLFWFFFLFGWGFCSGFYCCCFDIILVGFLLFFVCLFLLVVFFFVVLGFFSLVYKPCKCSMLLLQPGTATLQNPWVSVAHLGGEGKRRESLRELEKRGVRFSIFTLV